jgi:hypothetical protein
MYDAVELAEDLVDADMMVTCVPVLNADDEQDVAVVALEPSSYATRLLTSRSPELRIKALVAVAIHSHRLLPEQGLRFRCHSSS